MPKFQLPAGQVHTFTNPQRVVEVAVNDIGSTSRVTFTIEFADGSEEDHQSGYVGATMDDTTFLCKQGASGNNILITAVVNNSSKILFIGHT